MFYLYEAKGFEVFEFDEFFSKRFRLNEIKDFTRTF